MNDIPSYRRTSIDSNAEFISQARPGEPPPVSPEPPAPGDEDQTVVLQPFANLDELFEPAEEQTKVVVVEADPAFSPHPALLARQETAEAAPAGGAQSTPVAGVLKRWPVLSVVVSVALCLSLLGLVFSLFLNPSSSNHAPASQSMRSPANISSLAPSTPGLTPAPSPAASPAAPASMSMLPASSGSCRLGAVMVSRGSESLTADLTIINTGSTAIKSWAFVFFFSGKPAWVTYVSNGVFEQMGHQVTVSSPPYDPDTIVPGSSVHTSFQATWRGNNPMPASFRLTRLVCSI